MQSSLRIEWYRWVKEQVPPPKYLEHSCQDSRSRLARLNAFLTDIEHGSALLGSQLSHMFPQSLKLAGLPRYDFLGKVETLPAHLELLASRLNTTMKHRPVHTRNAYHMHSDSSRVEDCSVALEELDARTIERLCRIYDVDYTCFNRLYELPAECTGSL